MLIFGIDPGVSGAISKFEDGKLIDAYDMPTLKQGKKNKCNCAAIAKMLCSDEKAIVVIEQVSAMPGQGTASMFNFGMSFGMAQGVALGLGYELHLVTPQKWKKHFSLIGKDKDNARTSAQQLYPEASLSRKKDVGRADAILIARWFMDTNQ